MSVASNLLHAAINGVKIKFEFSGDADALMIKGRKELPDGRTFECSRMLSAQSIDNGLDPDIYLEDIVNKITTDILKLERA